MITSRNGVTAGKRKLLVDKWYLYRQQEAEILHKTGVVNKQCRRTIEMSVLSCFEEGYFLLLSVMKKCFANDLGIGRNRNNFGILKGRRKVCYCLTETLGTNCRAKTSIFTLVIEIWVLSVGTVGFLLRGRMSWTFTGGKTPSSNTAWQKL